LAEQIVFSRVSQGKVRIEGLVGSFYLKQMAQEIAGRDRAVTSVENRLRVQS
jgi:osmotically-inducible protein OsmY